MLIHWLWYSLLPGLSLRQKRALLERFSDPEDIFRTEDFSHIPDLTPEGVASLCDKDLMQARAIFKECTDKQIGMVAFGDAAYPCLLRGIADPPMVLYYKGILPDTETRPGVGIVGTRKASTYGLNVARSMGRQIASCGGLVVSGGADGIDTMALSGALDVGCRTVAVLGCGVDVVYPKKNEKLFHAIAQNGCLLSEYPPGTGPKAWQFPQRNRIISGMSMGVLVVEAPEKSGALITARDAAEQGKDLFVVPGNIGIASCAGSNLLLQSGAMPVFSGWDLMKEYEARFPDTVEKREVVLRPEVGNTWKVAQERRVPVASGDKKDIDNPGDNLYSVLDDIKAGLTEDERAVYVCLSTTPKSVDVVIGQAGLPAAKANTILARLALRGLVENHPGRLVSVKKQ